MTRAQRACASERPIERIVRRGKRTAERRTETAQAETASV